MRYIEKIQPSEEIQQVLASKSHYEGQMYEDETTLILNSLLIEQKNICCYCQETLTRPKASIEHSLPKSVFQSLQLSYSNFYATCSGGKRLRNESIEFDGLHCDKEKDDSIIPPYLQDQRNQTQLTVLNPYFYYDSKGYIIPNGCNSIDKVLDYANHGEKQLVWATILILNLNHPKLVDRREKAFRQFGQELRNKTILELKEAFKKLLKADSFMPFIEMRLQQIAQRYSILTQKETKK